jgi:hypothetical protein
MAASDHLSAVQWMPLSRIGQMRSGNDYNMTVEQEYQAKKAGRFSENDMARSGGNPQARQQEITSNIARHGQLNPAQWEHYEGYEPTLSEGAHRYAAHRDLGNVGMPVSRI